MLSTSGSQLPRVSVLVLNYNGREHLETCFRSLSALDYPPDRLKLVLVDNASTDDSVAWMRCQFPSVCIIKHEQNWGFCRGCNLAIVQVDADIIVLLDNSTRVAPECLKELTKPFADAHEIAVVGARMLDSEGKHLDFAHAETDFYGHSYQVSYSSHNVDAYNKAHPLLFVCGGAMAVRRDVFLDSGGFDEDFFACYADADLCWRLWVLGYEVWFAPRAIVHHHQPGNRDAVADAKRLVLYERNALLSIIKNCERENLQRVLSVALFLLLKRAYLLSDIDPAHYRVEQLPELTSLRDAEEVPQQVASMLLAASDVVTLLPRVMEKRRDIQARRRRPDAEMPSLLQALVRVNHTDQEYRITCQELANIFGLVQVFRQGRVDER